jgi:hypothetical protein
MGSLLLGQPECAWYCTTSLQRSAHPPRKGSPPIHPPLFSQFPSPQTLHFHAQTTSFSLLPTSPSIHHAQSCPTNSPHDKVLLVYHSSMQYTTFPQAPSGQFNIHLKTLHFQSLGMLHCLNQLRLMPHTCDRCNLARSDSCTFVPNSCLAFAGSLSRPPTLLPSLLQMRRPPFPTSSPG